MSALMKWNDKFMAEKMKKVKKNVTLACIHIQTDVKTRMSKKGTGRAYISRGATRTRVFRASNLRTKAEGWVTREGKKVGKGKTVESLFGSSYAGKTHIASREGEAPAVDLGELRNGVVYKVTVEKSMHLVRGQVGVREGLGPRAWHLETTLNRPAFIPALASEMPKYFARLKGK